MIPYALIVDSFLPTESWQDLRGALLSQDFPDQPNPTDGYQYPFTLVLDDWAELKKDITEQLQGVMGSRVCLRLLVARISTEGTPCPEQAHSDMQIVEPSPQYTMVLYMNTQAQSMGGTSLLRHLTMNWQFDTLDPFIEWRADQNIPEAWDKELMCKMQPNRAFIFASDSIHRSEPVGGFGKDKEEGRLVVVALFDLVPQDAAG